MGLENLRHEFDKEIKQSAEPKDHKWVVRRITMVRGQLVSENVVELITKTEWLRRHQKLEREEARRLANSEEDSADDPGGYGGFSNPFDPFDPAPFDVYGRPVPPQSPPRPPRPIKELPRDKYGRRLHFDRFGRQL